MEYITIYELEPKSLELYFLIIGISLTIIGVVGLRSVRKHGFIVQKFMEPSYMPQNYLNKLAEFFMFIIIVFGGILLVVFTIQMAIQLSNEKEIKKTITPEIITVNGDLIIGGNSIYENIRLGKSFMINNQTFNFYNAKNTTGWLPKNIIPIEKKIQKIRISFTILNQKNIILKIEEQTTCANNKYSASRSFFFTEKELVNLKNCETKINY